MLEALSHFNCALETNNLWFASAQSGVILWKLLIENAAEMDAV